MRGDNSALREAIAEVMAPGADLDHPDRSRLTLARAEAQARFDALSADPDNPSLLEASFDAQRHAEQLELDSRPQWLADTLGQRPADRALAQQWDQLGIAMIRLRNEHDITDELDAGLGRADVLLQRSLARFRVQLGLDPPSSGAELHRGRDITD